MKNSNPKPSIKKYRSKSIEAIQFFPPKNKQYIRIPNTGRYGSWQEPELEGYHIDIDGKSIPIKNGDYVVLDEKGLPCRIYSEEKFKEFYEEIQDENLSYGIKVITKSGGDWMSQRTSKNPQDLEKYIEDRHFSEEVIKAEIIESKTIKKIEIKERQNV